MLYLECYPFDRKLKPLPFFVYTVEVIEPRGAVLKSVLNSAACWLNHSTGYGAGYFACTDENRIYTRLEIAPEHLSCDYRGAGKTYIYRLIPHGKEVLSFSAHADVYASYLKQSVTLHLLGKRIVNQKTGNEEPFYFLQDNKLLSNYLLNPKNGRMAEIISDDGGIQLQRQYDFDFEVHPDGSGYLYLDTRSHYESTVTLYDLVKKQAGRTESVLKMHVKYDCPLSRPMYGIIVPQSEATDKDFSSATRASLFRYFRNKYAKNPKRTESFLKTIPQDDYVVFMKKNTKNIAFAVLASLVKPVVTQEYVASQDASFSRTIGTFTKCKMHLRLMLDKCFLEDIGALPNSDGVRVIFRPTKAVDLGYREERLIPPVLVIGKGREISCDQKSKNAIFGSSGYFSPAPIIDNHLRIGVICTDILNPDVFIRKLSPYLKMPKTYKPIVFHDFGGELSS